MSFLEQARYIAVSADVRYWEDGVLNGVEDVTGNMPCRNGDSWEPIIAMASGRILDWPQGVEARVYYKVCDAGDYWLLDAKGQRLAKWKGAYVPKDILCVGPGRHSDYIIFSIGPDGRILDWEPPMFYEDEWNPI